MTQIIARNLSLTIPTFSDVNKSLRRHITATVAKGSVASVGGVEVLKNVNFQINEGDRVGLFGVNGSGKTSLLRLISRIYEPTRGQLEISGKVHSLISLGTGLHPDLSGYENIIRLCLLTQPEKEFDQSYVDEVAEFSELGDFLKMPIRTYSAGMQLRLISGTIFREDFDIFAVDEFFGVGDENFSNKVQHRLSSMVSGSKIFLLASHSKELIEKHCNRLFLIENGNIIEKPFDQFRSA